MKNVIILTPGLSGSSVLSALLETNGYWVGNKTIKKEYDTHENSELVYLNKKILDDLDFNENWTMEFREDYTKNLNQGFNLLDKTPHINFIKQCESHSPWVWKDPRLWLTMGFWIGLLDMKNTAFLVIEREPKQAWISTTLRRQIQTMSYAKNYNTQIINLITRFLAKNSLNYEQILYEDLLLKPTMTLNKINLTTGASLNLNSLDSVFRGDLFQKQHKLDNYLHALTIYAKNYSIRYK